MPPRQRAYASREVVLAGGAFNTPQLLKLSGIGPREELERFGIPVRLELPGVGLNLQDRYEVGVVSKVKRDFSLLRDDRFRPPQPGEQPDPAFREWQSAGKGIYATNGALVAIIRRSRRELPAPDLFVFGLPAKFEGYYPGYSAELEWHHDYFTWAVLKAHTINRAGTVTLRSDDPREPPDIDFHYFDEGTDTEGADLEAVVDGVQLALHPGERTVNNRRARMRPARPAHDVELIPSAWPGMVSEVASHILLTRGQHRDREGLVVQDRLVNRGRLHHADQHQRWRQRHRSERVGRHALRRLVPRGQYRDPGAEAPQYLAQLIRWRRRLRLWVSLPDSGL